MGMNNMKKINVREFVWGRLRGVVGRIIPERTKLYKFLYLNAVKFQSTKRNRRQNSLTFQAHIMDSCNLNCAGCNNFSTLCENGFVDVEVFEKDINRISQLSGGKINKLLLTGGEPLLHPEIIKFIDISRKYFVEGEISLITNGVLLLRQTDEFWKSCKNNNVKVYITPYPIKLNYEEIAKTVNIYNVVLEYFYEGGKNTFRKIPLNFMGCGDILKNFKRCPHSSSCVSLRDGKLYGCQVPAYIDYFDNYFKQGFKVSEKDYIDTYDVKTVDEILDFVCKPIPFCRYCDVDNMEFGIKWKVSKKEISEWI